VPRFLPPLPAAGYDGRAQPPEIAVEQLRAIIRNIPDFPKPGIQFKDITPLVKDPPLLRLTVRQLIEPFLDKGLTAVAGMEARGFIFGSLAAWELGLGFVPLRKPGKLPYDVQRVSYDLEYGSAVLEMHIDALGTGDRVLLVDDLIATGGTAAASCRLIEGIGAKVAGCAFVVELDELKGRERLSGRQVHSLVHF
jgi:adenine phosphoribosyltransferase